MKKVRELRELTRIKIFLLLCLCAVISLPVFAENEFSVRIAPSIEAPVGLSEFSSGVGAKLSVDWAFFTFLEKFDVGVSAGGGFLSFPFEIGDPLSIFEVRGGPFIRYRPFPKTEWLDRLAFRVHGNLGGYQYSRAGEDEVNALSSFILGADFHITSAFSLYAEGEYTHRAFSSEPLPSIGAALGLRINLSELIVRQPRVQMEKIQQHSVFPVSWAWYENNPVATVKVTNEERNTISNINLIFYSEQFMIEPWVSASIPKLGPGESAEVDVTALFNESMINLSQNITANTTLQIQYSNQGTKKTMTTIMQTPVFRRNSLSWDDDRRAAAFVSPRDYAAMVFARNVAAIIESMPMGNTPRNVIYGIALYEALRLYRISYIVDPSNSYTRLSLDATALDSLNFPYETLYYRGGECDDLSILYCALLEALNIEAAFITVPGHIYAAFEVGDDAWLFGNPNIIELNGKRWIPMEATTTRQGFSQGWQIGMRQWRAAGNKAELLPIRDCWTIYPPVTVPASSSSLQDLPDLSTLVSSVAREAANYSWSAQQAAQARQVIDRRKAAQTAQRVELVNEINTKLEEQKIAGTTVEITEEGVMLRLSNIQFLADSVQLTRSEETKIIEISEIIKLVKGKRIQVTGHTAATGNREGELRVSRQRARAVANLLVEQEAVTETNLLVIGLGSDYPIADNSTRAGMAANRRVEITILE